MNEYLTDPHILPHIVTPVSRATNVQFLELGMDSGRVCVATASRLGSFESCAIAIEVLQDGSIAPYVHVCRCHRDGNKIVADRSRDKRLSKLTSDSCGNGLLSSVPHHGNTR